MNRLIYRHLKNLKVDKKRQILLRLSKSIGYNILEIKKLTDEEVQLVFDNILSNYKESDNNV